VCKWNGLKGLGLRVQLNHPPGIVCPYRKSAATDFILYDLNGVHELNVDFCGCGQPGGEATLERCLQLSALAGGPQLCSHQTLVPPSNSCGFSKY
jgi:hypothetical protein